MITSTYQINWMLETEKTMSVCKMDIYSTCLWMSRHFWCTKYRIIPRTERNSGDPIALLQALYNSDIPIMIQKKQIKERNSSSSILKSSKICWDQLQFIFQEDMCTIHPGLRCSLFYVSMKYWSTLSCTLSFLTTIIKFSASSHCIVLLSRPDEAFNIKLKTRFKYLFEYDEIVHKTI